MKVRFQYKGRLDFLTKAVVRLKIQNPDVSYISLYLLADRTYNNIQRDKTPQFIGLPPLDQKQIQ